MRMISEKINFSIFDKKPTEARDQFLTFIQLDPSITQVVYINIRYNEIQLADSFFYLGLNQLVQDSFYDVDVSNVKIFSFSPIHMNSYDHE